MMRPRGERHLCLGWVYHHLIGGTSVGKKADSWRSGFAGLTILGHKFNLQTDEAAFASLHNGADTFADLAPIAPDSPIFRGETPVRLRHVRRKSRAEDRGRR